MNTTLVTPPTVKIQYKIFLQLTSNVMNPIPFTNPRCNKCNENKYRTTIIDYGPNGYVNSGSKEFSVITKESILYIIVSYLIIIPSPIVWNLDQIKCLKINTTNFGKFVHNWSAF